MALKLAETEYEVLLTRQKLRDARDVANATAMYAGDMSEPFPVVDSQQIPSDDDEDNEMQVDTAFDHE